MRVMFASRMLSPGDGTTLSVGMISVRTADHGEENDKTDIMGSFEKRIEGDDSKGTARYHWKNRESLTMLRRPRSMRESSRGKSAY